MNKEIEKEIKSIEEILEKHISVEMKQSFSGGYYASRSIDITSAKIAMKEYASQFQHEAETVYVKVLEVLKENRDAMVRSQESNYDPQEIFETDSIYTAIINEYNDLIEIFESKFKEVPLSSIKQNDNVALELLKELCSMKKYKDEVGKDSLYLKEQPLLWEKANKFLDSLVLKPKQKDSIK